MVVGDLGDGDALRIRGAGGFFNPHVASVEGVLVKLASSCFGPRRPCVSRLAYVGQSFPRAKLTSKPLEAGRA